MCEKGFFNIKSVSNLSSKYAFVPCGECPSCRNVKRNSWVFRLRVEFEELVKKGWQVGFMTFTYNEKNVPRIPYKFVKKTCRDKYSCFKMPMCFNRAHVNGLIKCIRNWLYRDLGVAHDDKLRFLVASEFGEETARPHYHGIFCFPPRVDAFQFYKKLEEYWTQFGFIIPAEFLGGYDKKGHYHKPFMVDCVSKACKYTAKYVCKDLAFYDKVNREHFKNYNGDDKDKLSDYLPFHSQSKSLGIAFLNSLTDAQKLDYFINGVSFLGDDKLRYMPVYLKNKLMFANYYVVDSTGRRLCRRIASYFFEKYYHEIFNEKVRLVKDKVNRWLTENKSFVLDGKEQSTQQLFTWLDCTVENISAQYVAYYGLNPAYCYIMPLDKFWFERYRYVTDGNEIKDDLIEQVISEPWKYLTIDSQNKERMELFFTLLQIADNEQSKIIDVVGIGDERLTSRLRDLYYS